MSRTTALRGAGALPFLLAGLFVVGLGIELREVLTTIYLNGDAASAPVLAGLLDERGGGRVILGDYRWFEALYALRVVDALPASRQLGQLLPLVVYAASVAGVAWSVIQVAGRRRGLLVAALLACPSPLVLMAVATLNFHGLALAHTVLLGVALLVLVLRGGTWSGVQLAGFAVIVVLVSAPGVGSDQLVLLGGVVPFLFAATVLAVFSLVPRRVLVGAWAAGLGAVAAGALLSALGTGAGVRDTDRPFMTSTFAQVLDRAGLFLDGFAAFTHGATGQLLGVRTGAEFVAASGALVVLVVAGVGVRRTLPRLPELEPVRASLLLFWGTSTALLVAAFVSTSAAVDTTSVRYYLAAWPGVLVLITITLTPRITAPLLGAAAALVAALGLVDLVHGDYTASDPRFARGEIAGQLKRLVETEGLDHGYAGYWTAANLTYQTRLAARVYPVQPCGEVACPFVLHRLDAWYVPEAKVRSFYITDNAAPPPQAPQPPAEWQAVRTTGFGSLTVYIYDYDIASRLGPAPN